MMSTDGLFVVKFGGANLSSPSLISKAARSVVDVARTGRKIVVVVSAVGRTTDELLSTAQAATSQKLSPSQLDEILSMGERTSARFFAASLSSLGVKATFLDPSDPKWPIITNGSHTKAEPIVEACDEAIPRVLGPLMADGTIPVVPGFIGRSLEGEVTTLGRGAAT